MDYQEEEEAQGGGGSVVIEPKEAIVRIESNRPIDADMDITGIVANFVPWITVENNKRAAACSLNGLSGGVGMSHRVAAGPQTKRSDDIQHGVY